MVSGMASTCLALSFSLFALSTSPDWRTLHSGPIYRDRALFVTHRLSRHSSRSACLSVRRVSFAGREMECAAAQTSMTYSCMLPRVSRFADARF